MLRIIAMQVKDDLELLRSQDRSHGNNCAKGELIERLDMDEVWHLR